jgi:hypothetical protein
LLKGPYGLKQAGRVWYKKLYTMFINDLHFTQSGVNHSVFFRHHSMAVAANSDEAIALFKSQLGSHFELMDLGKIPWLLGFEIKCD